MNSEFDGWRFMKRLMWVVIALFAVVPLLIGFAVLFSPVAGASTYQPYVVRSKERSAEETVAQLENSKYFFEFQNELNKNTGLLFADLRIALEEGMLETRPCGECKLTTAGLIRGESVYHRKVRPEEPVAYVNGKAVFLPECGNPVRPIKDPPLTQLPQVLPLPDPVPVIVEAPKPEPPRVGCTEGNVQYSTGYWQNPGIGWWGGGGHGYSWTTSHHTDVECIWFSEKEEDK